MMPQVTRVPVVTKRLTTASKPCISLNLSVRLPSNRMTATDREIIGNNSLPKIRSGFSQPKTGPAKMPAISKKRMAGNFTRQANH